MHRDPQPPNEPRSTLDTLIGPLERLLGRRGEHREQTSRVRAEAFHQALGLYAVVLGLRHLADAPVLDADRAFGLGRHLENRGAAGVAAHVDIGRIEKAPPSIRIGRHVDVIQHEALRQQVREGL